MTSALFWFFALPPLLPSHSRNLLAPSYAFWAPPPTRASKMEASLSSLPPSPPEKKLKTAIRFEPAKSSFHVSPSISLSSLARSVVVVAAVRFLSHRRSCASSEARRGDTRSGHWASERGGGRRHFASKAGGGATGANCAWITRQTVARTKSYVDGCRTHTRAVPNFCPVA